MPIIKSAIKRDRQAIKRKRRNQLIKQSVKKDVKALVAAIDSKDAKAITASLKETMSELDRAVKRGAIHKNTASRRKSRLTKKANLVSAPKTAAKTAVKKVSPAKPKTRKPATKK